MLERKKFHPALLTLGFCICLLLSAVPETPLQPAQALAAQEGGTRPAQWAQPVLLPSSDNFYRINNDLYRSAQPDRQVMFAYADFGIRTVLNLRGFHSDEELVEGTSLALVEIPIHTWKAGHNDNVITMLQAIRDAKKPVLVHCQHGADRTGLAIAMYRIVEQGWSK